MKCGVFDLVRDLFTLTHAGVLESFPKSIIMMHSGNVWDSVKCPSKRKIAKIGKTYS